MSEEEVSAETAATTQEDVTASEPTETVTSATEDPTEAPPAETAASAEPTETATATVPEASSTGETAEEAAALDAVVAPEDAEAGETAVATAFATVEDAVAELEKVRKEAAEKRVSNRELTEKLTAIQERFGDTGEEFQEGWLELAKAFTENPEDPEVRAIFAELAGIEQSNAAPVSESAILDKVRSEFQEKQRLLEVQNIQNQLVSHARELGYDPDATRESDPVAFAHNQLLWAQVAATPDGGENVTDRLDGAHAAVQAYEQAVLDRKLAELSAANHGVPATRGSGTADVNTPEDEEPASTPSGKLKQAYQKSIRLAEEQASNPRF